MRLFQKSESVAAKRDIFVQMVDDDDLVTPKTGLSLTVQIVKAGGSAYGAIAGSSAEIGAGTYKISLAAADLDTAGEAMLKITATGAHAQYVPLEVCSLHDDLHLAKAIMGNARVHEITTGIDRVKDDDGETTLRTLTPAESIDLAGANWTDSTQRLSETGAFAKYIWESGDLISLTAGTGVVAGDYEIAARIDDDTIELTGDINGDGGDIDDGSVTGMISNGKIMVTVL